MKKNLNRFSKSLVLKAQVSFATLAVMVLPFMAGAATLTRQLELGNTGSDVSTLQSFLSQNQTTYPQGLVTGYFGFLTKAAVSNFQSNNGLAAVGRVGPQTLAVINFQMSGNSSNNTSTMNAPIITRVSINEDKNNASIEWSTNEQSKGMVYYSTNPINAVESLHAVSVTGSDIAMTDMSFRSAQDVSLPDLRSDTTYYYMIHTTDQEGNISVTWPSTFHTSN